MLLSRNLQVSPVVTKNLFGTKFVIYAVSFTDELSHVIVQKIIFNFK